MENIFSTDNPALSRMHREADGIQAYMNAPARLEDPASMTYRLNDLDVYMSRLGEMLTSAKAMKEKAQNEFWNQNEAELTKLTATIQNRKINAHLFEYATLYTRLDTMYHTLEHLTRDLVTQISYIKQQMIMH